MNTRKKWPENYSKQTYFKNLFFFFFFPPNPVPFLFQFFLSHAVLFLSFLLPFLSLLLFYCPPTHLTWLLNDRRGMNQAATAATAAASQAFGAMGQQVQKAAAQAAAQAAVNEVQNQFSNMMRTGVKK